MFPKLQCFQIRTGNYSKSNYTFLIAKGCILLQERLVAKLLGFALGNREGRTPKIEVRNACFLLKGSMLSQIMCPMDSRRSSLTTEVAVVHFTQVKLVMIILYRRKKQTPSYTKYWTFNHDWLVLVEESQVMR